MINQDIDAGICKILNSYNFLFSHNETGWDCRYYNPKGYTIVYDQKEEIFSLFDGPDEMNEIQTLEGEHLTLNAICAILSKLNY